MNQIFFQQLTEETRFNIFNVICNKQTQMYILDMDIAFEIIVR